MEQKKSSILHIDSIMRELLETKTKWMEFVKTLLFENKLLRSVYQLFFKRILCFRTKKKKKKRKTCFTTKEQKTKFYS